MAAILSDEIITHVRSLMNSERGKIPVEAVFEFEARFKNVTPDAYQRVIDLFEKSGSKLEDRHMSDSNVDGWRRTVSGIDSKVNYMRKTSLWTNRNDADMYGVRLSLATEQSFGDKPPAAASSLFADSTKLVIRDKRRTSFLIINSKVRLDATRVRMKRPGKPDETSYELELELVDLNAFKQMRNAIGVVLSVIQDSEMIISDPMAKKVIAYIRTLTSDEKNPDVSFISMFDLSQPRDLSWRDLVYGGLVGNRDTPYAVTAKADGERRLLAFTPYGVFIVGPRTQYLPARLNRISAKVFDDITGTILDGEMIPENRRRYSVGKKHLFIAFDCISFAGNVTVRQEGLMERLNYCKRITDQSSGDALIPNVIAIESLAMASKPFYLADSAESLYLRSQQVYAENESAPYFIDGLNFSPVNTPYITAGASEKPSDRVLTKYADHVKWKPPSHHSIDFAVLIQPASSGRRFTLATGPDRRNRTAGRDLAEWKGSDRNPFAVTESSVDLSGTILTATALPAHGTVVEMRWDGERKMLVPMRIRHDKDRPNAYETAVSVWDNINDPIPREVLFGVGMAQLRKYHNQLKRKVIDALGRRSLVVDVGSGYGGDLSKWRSFERIIAVEPDPEHRAEFSRRLSSMGTRAPDVTLISGGGEDLLEIVPDKERGKVDAITLMLSLTFFFERDASGRYPKLDRLAQACHQLLAPGGKIAFMTMNGDAAKRILSGDPIEWSTPGMYVNLTGENEVKIHIPNSIVEHQSEWLVSITEFVDALHRAGGGWSVDMHERASTGAAASFMPPDSIVLNKMYSYGIISRDDTKKQKKETAKQQRVGRQNGGERVLVVTGYSFARSGEGVVKVYPRINPDMVNRIPHIHRAAAAASALDAAFQKEPSLLTLAAFVDGAPDEDKDFAKFVKQQTGVALAFSSNGQRKGKGATIGDDVDGYYFLAREEGALLATFESE